MKLEYFEINGYGFLIDRNIIIKKGDMKYCPYDDVNKIHLQEGFYYDTNEFKIVFAEKELNFNVPILPNLKEWEVEKIAEQYTGSNLSLWVKGFIAGFNHNKNSYSEEDLRKAFDRGEWDGCGKSITTRNNIFQNFIKTLKKVPIYIIIESFNKTIYSNDGLDFKSKPKPKLITNSEGKQECIIKEIIY